MHSATWRRRIRAGSTIFAAALSALVLAGVASAGWGQPSGITDQARDMHHLYLLVTAVAAVVFILVEVALIFILFRYRRRDDTLPPQTHGNNLLEIIWTTIPIVIVLILFVFSFITIVEVDKDADDDALTVEVQGFQFQWAFRYNLNDLGVGNDASRTGYVEELGTAANEPTLVIPVDEPIEFKLRSDDVIHSFYIRDFLYKLDVIPGRDNRFTVTARETGEFIGQCAELCGLDHGIMRFKLQVVERAEFDEYIAGLPVKEDTTQQQAVRP